MNCATYRDALPPSLTAEFPKQPVRKSRPGHGLGPGPEKAFIPCGRGLE